MATDKSLKVDRFMAGDTMYGGFSMAMLESQKEPIFNSSLSPAVPAGAVALVWSALATPCADFASKKGPIHAAGCRAPCEIQGHGAAGSWAVWPCRAF